jgi:hypothetical protein
VSQAVLVNAGQGRKWTILTACMPAFHQFSKMLLSALPCFSNSCLQELQNQNVEGDGSSLEYSPGVCGLALKQAQTLFQTGEQEHDLDEYGAVLLNISLKLNRNRKTNAALLRARAILDTIPRRQEALIKGF